MRIYDTNNVFAKILREELPCNKIYEDDHVLCFEDASKSAKTHWLVIPKTHHTCFHEFISNSKDEVISAFFKAIKKITEDNGLDKFGYKLVTNNGENVGQSVFHFHMHILSGEKMNHL
ncbi:MAG: HIT domain-containing protein [Alphaproteobacteria bacterium]|nr:HIT domain-containing protein [Alphaproteobacteria bacterium]